MSFWERMSALFSTTGGAALSDVRFSLAAHWAHENPWLVAAGCALLLLGALAFYRWLQPVQRPAARWTLGVMRGSVLALLLLLLAEPTLVLHVVRQPRPWLWLLFDGSQSMAIEDDLPPADRQQLATALDLTDSAAQPRSRQSYVQALLQRERNPWLERLAKRFRVRAFVFDSHTGVRSLIADHASDAELDGKTLAGMLDTRGELTALGTALADLAHRQTRQNLAGVVVFSDFDQNTGLPAVAAAEGLHAPVYSVGIGPDAAADVSVELTVHPLLKKSESVSLPVTIRQAEFDGQSVTVRLLAWPPTVDAATAPPAVVDERSVRLDGSAVTINFSITPEEVGRWVLAAEVSPQAGEVIRDNNVARREVTVQDNFLRLMFVEYEPTWEWRFIKEVFHRDPLVGERGFRTFLRSADPKVRQSNELFLASLVPPRNEFFANDVIFLGDVPAQALSNRFGERVKEFVDMFHGGVVILAGPNFGPGQLVGTPLADLLPVVVDPDARLRDERPFTPRLTREAERFDFMQLGSSAAANAEAWSALDSLPWYQPALRVRDGSSVLLAHPTDMCVDGHTPQPLVVIRPYGKGQVVYFSFNETWRLRRKFGEKYYRKFWGQLIYRLGLSHALGDQKRFVVRTDRQNYQVDDTVLVTVDAFDEDYNPLTADKLAARKLTGQLQLPSRSDGASGATPAVADRQQQSISLTEVRPGVFETRVAAIAEGEYRLRIDDPIARQSVDKTFTVAPISIERRSAVRNTSLEQQLASTTGGRVYDLATVDRLPDEIPAAGRSQSSVEVIPLGNTWLGFGLLVSLLVVEWLVRKLLNLA